MFDINKFKEEGYIIIEKFIPQNYIEVASNLCVELKNFNDSKLTNGKPSGSVSYWKGLDMASTYSLELLNLYTSDLMFNIATSFLETNEPYLFNDQIVVKLPNDNFKFEPHTDNMRGPNPKAAALGNFKTITCCWVLDDFTKDNGPISILNTKTNKWETPLPNKGDLLIWDGNTLHSSTLNKTTEARKVWLQIYSTENLTKVSDDKNFDDTRFYGEKFVLGMQSPIKTIDYMTYNFKSKKNLF